MKIHIFAIETGLQSHAIRLAAEYWGADVTVTWVGNSRQIVDYFSAPPAHELLIIAGHGDERGLLLPELGQEIQHLYPYNGVITPQDFRHFLRAPLPIVLNLACHGGAPALAEAFLEHGAPAYIGATTYPNADATLMYALEFLYTYVQNGKHLGMAHQQAAAHDDDRQQFHVYQALPTSP